MKYYYYYKIHVNIYTGTLPKNTKKNFFSIKIQNPID